MRVKILIADDHEMVRDTISAFLAREEDIDVFSVPDFAAAMKRMQGEGPFDLVLLDYTMPGMNGLEGLARALAANGGKGVALISGTASRDIAEEALNAGAIGFLPKTMPAKTLLHAVRFMAAGEQYAPVKFMTEREEVELHPLAARLSEREQQVLQGLGRGLSNKEIARELELQEVTVKLHVKTLCRKLDARNRTHAAMIGREAGLC